MWVLWHVPYSAVCVCSLRLTSLIHLAWVMTVTHLMLPILDQYLKIRTAMALVIVLCTSCPRFPINKAICWRPILHLLLVSHWNSEFSTCVLLLRIVQFDLRFGEHVHHLLELPGMLPLLFFDGFSLSSLFCLRCSARAVSARLFPYRWYSGLV